MKRTIQIMLLLSAVSIIALIGYISFIYFYPYKTLTMSSITFPSEVKAGSTVFYSTAYCSYGEYPFAVGRYLRSTDGKDVWPFPVVKSIMQITPCTTAQVPLAIDANTTPNTYYMLIDVDISILGIRSIHIVARSNNFRIIK